MKKTLVAAILGLAATASVMAQGRIVLESYLSGNYPTITYGAGANGTFGAGVNTSYTVGLYYSLTPGAAFVDPSGTGTPSGSGWTLATTAGSTAQILGGLPGIYSTGTDFSIPGYVDSSPSPSLQVSIVIIAYSGASYATSTYRGHSAAYNMSPTLGAGFAAYTGTGQNAFSVVPVPEPSTFALAGLGLAGLLIFRRRK